MRTERITILATPEQKAAMNAKARELGMTVSEMLRFAFDSLDPLETQLVEGLAREIDRAVTRAREAVADAHREVEETLRMTRSQEAAAAA